MVNFRGIGPKTAAFFLLHSRRVASIPVIDTHICKYAKSKGVDMKVTSDLKRYLANAALVQGWISKDFPMMTLAEADLYLWIKYSGRARTEYAGEDSNIGRRDMLNPYPTQKVAQSDMSSVYSTLAAL
jgi:hypothetical protein